MKQKIKTPFFNSLLTQKLLLMITYITIIMEWKTKISLRYRWALRFLCVILDLTLSAQFSRYCVLKDSASRRLFYPEQVNNIWFPRIAIEPTIVAFTIIGWPTASRWPPLPAFHITFKSHYMFYNYLQFIRHIADKILRSYV